MTEPLVETWNIHNRIPLCKPDALNSDAVAGIGMRAQQNFSDIRVGRIAIRDTRYATSEKQCYDF